MTMSEEWSKERINVLSAHCAQIDRTIKILSEMLESHQTVEDVLDIAEELNVYYEKRLEIVDFIAHEALDKEEDG